MNRTSLLLASTIAFLPSCTSVSSNQCGNTSALVFDTAVGGGGAGGDAQASEGGSGGGQGQPGAKRISLGFGAYAPACGSPNVFTQQGEAGVDLGHVATLLVTVPFPGTVVRASMVYAIDGGECDAAPRDVLVSEPFKGDLSSPGLHERLSYGTAEIVSSPVYSMPGIEVGRARTLGRDLAVPFHVGDGETVGLGAPLTPTSACLVGCSARLDGNDPPAGSTDCADGQAWADCKPSDFYLAYAAWVDVVPD